MELVQLDGYAEPVTEDCPSSPHFDETPVPVSALADILNAGHMALSGYDLQPARFVLLRSAERKASLHRAIFGPAQEKVDEAPVIIVALAPRNDPGLRREVMAAFTRLMSTAASLGWDTSPVDGFDPDAVSAALGLSAESEVVALLTVGRFRLQRERQSRLGGRGGMIALDKAHQPFANFAA